MFILFEGVHAHKCTHMKVRGQLPASAFYSTGFCGIKFKQVSFMRSLFTHLMSHLTGTPRVIYTWICLLDAYLFCFWRLFFVFYPRLAWNFLYSPAWAWTCNFPASASLMLSFQVCATMSSFTKFFYYMKLDF